MRLSDQQRKAVQYPESAFIEASPGSGKTRTLTAKLIDLLDSVRGTPRKIACITYTNAAVHEIENRVRKYERNDDEFSYEVATIHSFCLTNVLGPYYWKLQEYKTGYEILPSDSDEYDEIARKICTRHSLNYNWDVKRAFEQLGRHKDGSPIAPYPLDTQNSAVYDFWDELERLGYIDFTNIVYCSYRLVSRHSEIAKSVASKYAWILVDEFQDTTALQFEVLSRIADAAITKFFLVGDPNQSIFGFAGATPEAMYDFSDRVQADSRFALNHNWRSSSNIVDEAESLIPRSPTMVAVGENRDFEFAPYRRHFGSAYEAIADHFLPLLEHYDIPYGDAAILAPWWTALYGIGKRLSADGVPIVGPGARPYRRSRYLFARFAERICEYIETREPHLIPLLERELFILVRDLTGQPNFRVFSYSGRRIVMELVKRMGSDIDSDALATTWLQVAVQSMREVLEGEELIQKSHGDLLSQSVNDMIKEIRNNKNTRDRPDSQLKVRDLAIFASYSKNIKLLTFHGAKGLEFDAVALIDMHEGKIPHFSINYKSYDEQQRMLEESKRVFYVGITRAKRLLMYFTDDSDTRNPPSRLLSLVEN
ncbi:MAG: ATP-dependent helicase [Chloroflexi bacterium]|nr:ATP-dependent helicase [Chloroflexota bacterium]